jgi:hypothetical protein
MKFRPTGNTTGNTSKDVQKSRGGSQGVAAAENRASIALINALNRSGELPIACISAVTAAT